MTLTLLPPPTTTSPAPSPSDTEGEGVTLDPELVLGIILPILILLVCVAIAVVCVRNKKTLLILFQVWPLTQISLFAFCQKSWARRLIFKSVAFVDTEIQGKICLATLDTK